MATTCSMSGSEAFVCITMTMISPWGWGVGDGVWEIVVGCLLSVVCCPLFVVRWLLSHASTTPDNRQQKTGRSSHSLPPTAHSPPLHSSRLIDDSFEQPADGGGIEWTVRGLLD